MYIHNISILMPVLHNACDELVILLLQLHYSAVGSSTVTHFN